MQRFGRHIILPPNPDLFTNPQGILTESVRVATMLARATTLLAVVADEVLRGTANTVSRILDQVSVGELAFVASEDHASVTNYTARVLVSEARAQSAPRRIWVSRHRMGKTSSSCT